MARKTFWIDKRINQSIGAGGQTSESLFEGTPPINTRQTTVVRQIIDLYMQSATVAGAWGSQIIDIGIGVISQEAATAQVFPDPNADERPVSGWLFRTQCMVAQNGVGAQILYECHRDIRTGRKVYDGELTIIINSLAGPGTAFTTQVRGMVRTLLLLP